MNTGDPVKTAPTASTVETPAPQPSAVVTETVAEDPPFDPDPTPAPAAAESAPASSDILAMIRARQNG